VKFKKELEEISEELHLLSDYALNMANGTSEEKLSRIYREEQINTMKIRVGQLKYKLTGKTKE